MDDAAFPDLGYDDEDDNFALNGGKPDAEEIPSSSRAMNVASRSDLISSRVENWISNQQNKSANSKSCLNENDDWNPLDWHMNLNEEMAEKRRRLEGIENAVASATAKILDVRMRRKAASSRTSQKQEGDNAAKTDGKENETECSKALLLKYPPVDGRPWVGVCSADHLHRAYLAQYVKPQKDVEWSNASIYGLSASSNYKFQALMEEVLTEKALEGIFKQNPLECNVNDLISDKKGKLSSPLQNELWIDKYAPKNFLELVTEDEKNRLALLWLKSWDEYVFHRSFKYDSLEEKDKRFLEMETTKATAPINQMIQMPRLKILMIQGSSGKGKSCLAVIAAKQAGYRPFIINISEVQSLAEFRSKIEDVSGLGAIDVHFKQNIGRTPSKSLNKHQPTCLIIDGLEYGGPEIAKFLANWITKSSKKEGKRNTVLTVKRPIICTCNNVFVPALKELRPYILTLRISECNQKLLLRRLQKICSIESINIPPVELERLLSACRSDIRLCLNTLQFYYTFTNSTKKETKSSNALYFDKLTVKKDGRGNADTSIFDTIAAVLTLDQYVDGKGMLAEVSKRCENVYDIMNHCEDMDRLYALLFHNLNGELKLSHKQRKDAALYFISADLNHQIIYSGQRFELLRYQAFIAVGLHLCLATFVSKRLSINLQAQQAYNEKLKNYQQILRYVRTGAMWKEPNWLTYSDLTQSVLPALYFIIQPPIQPMNAQLYGGADLVAISNVVDVMISFGLTYTLKYEDIGANYSMEPAIDVLTCFPQTSQSALHTYSSEIQQIDSAGNRPKIFLANNTKKFIAHQIELAKIRGGPTRDQLDDDQNLSVPTTPKTPHLKELAQRINRKPTTPLSRTPFAQKRNKTLHLGFTFRYNQGSTQAIRRNIRIDALFFK
ncbi:chromosome transmission fidelity protein 18 like protein [Ditylenchus destructor]|nr:chromosome transmission fidelity protein 18 like protein [Ditylenchus destructor]